MYIFIFIKPGQWTESKKGMLLKLVDVFDELNCPSLFCFAWNK